MGDIFLFLGYRKWIFICFFLVFKEDGNKEVVCWFSDKRFLEYDVVLYFFKLSISCRLFRDYRFFFLFYCF